MLGKFNLKWSDWLKSQSANKMFASHPGLAVHNQLFPGKLRTLGPDVCYVKLRRLREFTAMLHVSNPWRVKF